MDLFLLQNHTTTGNQLGGKATRQGYCLPWLFYKASTSAAQPRYTQHPGRTEQECAIQFGSAITQVGVRYGGCTQAAAKSIDRKTNNEKGV